MKNVVIFLCFIIYATAIFFIPNTLNYLLLVFSINIIIMLIIKVNVKKMIKNTLYVIPFVVVTGIINCFLGNYIYAFYISIKLILVCNITYIYSKTTTVLSVATTVKTIFKPLEIFKINVDEIEILVALALTMVPVLRREFKEIKYSCIAKNIKWNIKNMKIILSKFMISIFKRVNELDEALREKNIYFN